MTGAWVNFLSEFKRPLRPRGHARRVGRLATKVAGGESMQDDRLLGWPGTKCFYAPFRTANIAASLLVGAQVAGMVHEKPV